MNFELRWTFILMILCKCNWSVNVFRPHLSCDMNQFTCGLKNHTIYIYIYIYILLVCFTNTLCGNEPGVIAVTSRCIWSPRALTCTVYSQVPTIPLPLAVLKIQPEVLKPLEVWILYWTSFVINGLFTFTFCANSPHSLYGSPFPPLNNNKKKVVTFTILFSQDFFHRIQNYYLNTSW